MRKFNGRKRTVASGEAAYFRGWKDWNEGDLVQCTYESMYESEFRGAVHPNHRVRVHYCNFDVFDKEGNKVDIENKLLVLNSAGGLNKTFEKEGIGTVFEVVYDGKKTNKEGTEFHSFEVSVLKEEVGEGGYRAEDDANDEDEL